MSLGNVLGGMRHLRPRTDISKSPNPLRRSPPSRSDGGMSSGRVNRSLFTTVAPMDSPAVDPLVAGCVLAAGGVVVAMVGRRGQQGRLSRQHWAGIRTPSTMRSDEAWSAAHRAGGMPMEIVGWAAVALGGVAALLCATDQSWTTALPLTAVGLLLLGVIYGGIRGVRAARRLR